MKNGQRPGRHWRRVRTKLGRRLRMINPFVKKKKHGKKRRGFASEPSVREFFVRRFGRQPEHDLAYFRTWKERFRYGNPEVFMDSKSLKVYRDLKKQNFGGAPRVSGVSGRRIVGPAFKAEWLEKPLWATASEAPDVVRAELARESKHPVLTPEGERFWFAKSGEPVVTDEDIGEEVTARGVRYLPVQEEDVKRRVFPSGERRGVKVKELR